MPDSNVYTAAGSSPLSPATALIQCQNEPSAKLLLSNQPSVRIASSAAMKACNWYYETVKKLLIGSQKAQELETAICLMVKTH